MKKVLRLPRLLRVCPLTHPGRFQPMGRHHFQTYQQIATENGIDTTYVVTSDKTGPKSPLNFSQKKAIMGAHGIPDSQVIQVKNPYYAKEISGQFDPEEIEMVYFVGAKDMSTNPRFQKTSGTTKEGVDWKVVVAPHVKIDVPRGGEMSGTTLRQSLKDASAEEFEALMGWYDEGLHDMLRGVLEEISGAGGGGSSMSGGSVGGVSSSGIAGYSLPLGAKPRHPEIVGSEKKKKRKKDEFLKEELVSEVMDYLLGISVG